MATWHDAASAEHWYRHEKDYGDDGDDEGWFYEEEEHDDENERH